MLARASIAPIARSFPLPLYHFRSCVDPPTPSERPQVGRLLPVRFLRDRKVRPVREHFLEPAPFRFGVLHRPIFQEVTISGEHRIIVGFKQLIQLRSEYVENSEIGDKEFYIKFTFGQLSNSELILVGINCAFGRGREKFKGIIEKYGAMSNTSFAPHDQKKERAMRTILQTGAFAS